MEYIKRLKYLIRNCSLLYRDCSELTMDVFIECLRGNLEALNKSFIRAPKKKLKERWDAIYLEYIDLIDDAEKVKRVSLMKQITAIEVEKNLLDTIFLSIKILSDTAILDVCKRLGYSFDTNDYAKSVKRIRSQFKSREFELRELKVQLEALLKAEEINSKASTDINFDPIFIQFSRFQEYRIKPSETTVSEFAAILNQFKKHNTKTDGSGKNNRLNRR